MASLRGGSPPEHRASGPRASPPGRAKPTRVTDRGHGTHLHTAKPTAYPSHPMRTLLALDAHLHAPTSTREGLLSAYAGGMIGAACGVRLSADGVPVIYHSLRLELADGADAPIADLTFHEIRVRSRKGLKFASGANSYRGTIDSIDTLLGVAPRDFLIVLHLESPSDLLLNAIVGDIQRNPRANVVFRLPVGNDGDRLRAVYPRARIVLHAVGADDIPDEHLHRAQGVAVSARDLIRSGRPTALGSKLAQHVKMGRLPEGVIVVPRSPIPTPHELDVAATWGVGNNIVESASHLSNSDFVRRERLLISESFAGSRVDTENWSIGYARSNSYCHVFQDDGLHIKIEPFTPAPPPSAGPEGRIDLLEQLVLQALYRTPTYSGGGIGCTRGIVGDFSAECNLRRERSAQATTAEMAITNVDPGRHIPSWNADGSARLPRGAHDMHTFFDTHGAPPYVGVEQDENDGFRINWNLGTSYYDNQYGVDVGPGASIECKLRIERRGPYFAAYFRDGHAEDWVVAGVTRNDSLSPRIFLRFVGKRWQKADPSNPGQTLPVVANHFVFSDVTIRLAETDDLTQGS